MFNLRGTSKDSRIFQKANLNDFSKPLIVFP